MKLRSRRTLAVAASTCLLSVTAIGYGTTAEAADGDGTEPVVVASGFNNPRQITMTHDGVLLVAEAGRGGDECIGEGEEQQCIGDTGAVSAIFQPMTAENGYPVRVLQNLLSGAGPDGSFAIGSSGVSTERFYGGSIYSSVSFAPPEILPEGLPGDQSGSLLKGTAGQEVENVANVSAYELENDVDGYGVESNPYAVLDMRDFRLVADAAANALFKVTSDGTVSTFHVFPNITTEGCVTPNEQGWPGYSPDPSHPGCNFVPTSLALGPDSDVYVGSLSSEVPGEGQVVRLDHATGAVKRVYSGFGGVTGVALDNEGSIYVSQLFTPGTAEGPPGIVTKVKQDGQRTSKDVPFPAGVAVDHHRNVYVAAFSVASEDGMGEGPPGMDTSGQIWRLRF